MKRNTVRFLTVFAFLMMLSSPSFSFEGPLPIRNQFPLYGVINPPSLEKASVEDSFSMNLSHASVFMVGSSSDWSVSLDMEVTELDFRFRKSFADSFEFGVEVPVTSFNSGFMDGFLNDYHSTFGFLDNGKSTRPSNEFLYEVRRNGVLLIKGNTGTGIGDIRLTAKKTVLKGDPAVSLLVNAELPTGEASRGFGNGSLDAGAAVLVDKRIGENVTAYGNLGILFPGKFRAGETLKLETSVYAGVGIEAAVWSNLSLLSQILIERSPFPKTGISYLDRPAVLLSLGGRYSCGKYSFDFGFTEDPNTAGAPDFSVTVSFKRRF